MDGKIYNDGIVHDNKWTTFHSLLYIVSGPWKGGELKT